MKALFTLSLFSLLTSTAFAHPGGSKLVCKSAATSGSTQKIFVSIVRSNGQGWFAPIIKARIAGKNFTMTTPDEMQNYGETFHNSPLGVIRATVSVPFENAVAGDLSIVAIPSSVKAFDYEGNPVKWNLEAEKDECNDVHGSALFQGIIHGSVYENAQDQHLIETQVMDCKLTYDPGMSC